MDRKDSRRSLHSINGLLPFGRSRSSKRSLITNEASISSPQRPNLNDSSVIGGGSTFLEMSARQDELTNANTHDDFSLPGMSLDTQMIYPCSSEYKAKANRQRSPYYWAPADYNHEGGSSSAAHSSFSTKKSIGGIPGPQALDETTNDDQDKPFSILNIRNPPPSRPPRSLGRRRTDLPPHGNYRYAASRMGQEDEEEDGQTYQLDMDEELGILYEEEDPLAQLPPPVPLTITTLTTIDNNPPPRSIKPKQQHSKTQKACPPDKEGPPLSSTTTKQKQKQKKKKSVRILVPTTADKETNNLNLKKHSPVNHRRNQLRLAAILACAVGMLLLSTAALVLALFFLGHGGSGSSGESSEVRNPLVMLSSTNSPETTNDSGNGLVVLSERPTDLESSSSNSP